MVEGSKGIGWMLVVEAGLRQAGSRRMEREAAFLDLASVVPADMLQPKRMGSAAGMIVVEHKYWWAEVYQKLHKTQLEALA